jgi:hypothetical protein
MSSKSSELEKRKRRQPLCQADVVEIVEAVDRITKGLIVLLLNQKVVVFIIDSFNVQLIVALSDLHMDELQIHLHAEQR